MFTDLASVRDGIAERLAPLLPDTWEIVRTLSEAKKLLTPALYIEFTGFASAVNDKALSRTQVLAKGEVVVASVETDTEKGEKAADEHVLKLVQAFQSANDLYWDTAQKDRLTGGQIAWRVSFGALVNNHPVT